MDALYSLAKVSAKLGQAEEAARYREQFEKLKADQRRVDTGSTNVRNEIQDDRFLPMRVGEILTYAGRAYLAHDDVQRAEPCFLKAAAVSSKDVDCRQLLSEITRKQGRFGDSLRWVKELKQIQPKNNLHYRNEGLLYVSLGRLDDAERVFRDICALEPARAFGYAALADLYLQAGRNLAQAGSLAERAVDLEPSAGHWRLLAAIAQKSGDNATARAATEQARIAESSATNEQATDAPSAEGD
jgi:tetratricopeptide (TPR) repeat protein